MPPVDLHHSAPKSVPEPTLRRLPIYHHYLKTLEAFDKYSVSCTDIGNELKLDPTQVRKDLETTGIVGKPRVGYVLSDLIGAIEEFLGWNNLNEAFLIGAGSMGAALLGYRKFEDYGLNILAAFDSDEKKVGRTIHGKPVLPLGKLANLAQRMHVRIGIITVPAAAAQEVAELLVAGGIRAIWNFAPVRLRVDERVIVHNEDLYCSLAALSRQLAGVIHGTAKGRSTEHG